MRRLLILLPLLALLLAACADGELDPYGYPVRSEDQMILDAQATARAASANARATEMAAAEAENARALAAAHTRSAAEAEIALIQEAAAGTRQAIEAVSSQTMAAIDQAESAARATAEYGALTQTAAAQFTATAAAGPRATATQAAFNRLVKRDETRAAWQESLVPIQALLPYTLVMLLVLAIAAALIVAISRGTVLVFRHLPGIIRAWELRLRTVSRPDGTSLLLLNLRDGQVTAIHTDKMVSPGVSIDADGMASLIAMAGDPAWQERHNARNDAVRAIAAFPSDPHARREARQIAGEIADTAALPAGPALPPVAPWGLLSTWSGHGFPLGMSERGGLLEADPDKSPHLMFVGTSGAGKTRCGLLPLAAAALAAGHQVVLLNAAGADFQAIERHVNLVSPADNSDDVAEILELIAHQVDLRSRILRDTGVTTWDRLPANLRKEHPRLLVIVDELVALAWGAGGRTAARIWSAAIHITSQGRKMGINLACATTDPTYKTLGRQGLVLRDNCAVIAYQVRSPSVSKAVLDTFGAESLPENQFLVRMMMAGQVQLERGVAFRPSDEEVYALVASREYPIHTTTWMDAGPLITSESSSAPADELTDEKIQQIRALRAQGLSQAEIERQIFGYTGGQAYHNVRRALQDFNGPTTTPGSVENAP